MTSIKCYYKTKWYLNHTSLFTKTFDILWGLYICLFYCFDVEGWVNYIQCFLSSLVCASPFSYFMCVFIPFLTLFPSLIFLIPVGNHSNVVEFSFYRCRKGASRDQIASHYQNLNPNWTHLSDSKSHMLPLSIADLLDIPL